MIEFDTPRNMRWDLDSEEVRFAAVRDQKMILCRVSGAAIRSHFVISGSNEGVLQAARRNFDKISKLAHQAIVGRRFETDDSIFLSSADFETRSAFDA